MKELKFAGSVFLIYIMILSALGSAVRIEVKAEPAGKSSTNGLTPHEPIYIDGNNDFALQAASKGWHGNGTSANPYIIENYDINASWNGIEIRNTDKYFIIRNCIIHGGRNKLNDGINFCMVQNGKIDNVTSYNNSLGIYQWDSSNNTITNCAVYNNGEGIYQGYSSNNNKIANCAVHNNSWYGIRLHSSSNNNIRNNTFLNNGIVIWGDSLNHYIHSISDNIVNSKPLYYYLNQSNVLIDRIPIGQLILVNCSRFSIRNINISNASVGIEIAYSSNNNITNCAAYNNSYGISLVSSSNNQIHHCDIYNNTDYGIYNYNSATQYSANATYNWWGSLDGPSGKGPGGGDKVSDNVLYDPWLTKPWEEGIEISKPTEKTVEGFNIIYFIVIVAAVAAGIIVAVFLLRRRVAIPKPEIPALKPELIPPAVPTLTLRCPQCKSTFTVEKKEKPFKVKCPSCGTEGMIR